MRIFALICRILLGLLFVVAGANVLHPFRPMPKATLPPLVVEYMHVFMTSGWMKVIGAFQLLGGLLVLFGGTLPLGLCILCPITVNILCFHLLLTHGGGIGPGALAAGLEIVLIYYYRNSFAGIFSAHERPSV